jgi:hypothetical protein
MPRRNWIAPSLTQLRGTDSRAVSTVFQSLTSYLRGHVGFWGTYTGTTNIYGFLTVPIKCGFVPDKVFVQRVHDASSPLNSYGGMAVYLPTLTEDNLDVLMMNLDGTADTSSGNRTIMYHILPKVKER